MASPTSASMDLCYLFIRIPEEAYAVLKTIVAMLLALVCAPASAQEPFKIGVVASVSGGFAAAAKDTIDGWRAWEKARGLPGRQIVLETLDDETNPVSATN